MSALLPPAEDTDGENTVCDGCPPLGHEARGEPNPRLFGKKDQARFILAFSGLQAKSCLTLYDRTDRSTPGFSALHSRLEFAQIHVP